MKEFFSRYSYGAVKLYVTQIAIGLFGAVIAMATSGINEIILLVTGIFAALFYLFLIYTSVWTVGAKDKISIDVGKLKVNDFRGVLIALIANIPNLIIATVYTVCWFIAHGEASTATSVGGFMRILTMITEGMYYGIMSALPLGSALTEKLFTCWWMYFVIALPSIIVSGLAYWLGTKNFKLTGMMDPVYPESDREPKIKK